MISLLRVVIKNSFEELVLGFDVVLVQRLASGVNEEKLQCFDVKEQTEMPH